MINTSDISIIQGDSFQILSTLTDRFAMIFADPPYFLSNGGISVSSGKMVSVDKGEWDKGGTPEHIHEFNMKWLGLCRERLTENGTIWVSGTFHNIYDVEQCMVALGYKILNVITWQKSDPPPIVSTKRFQFSTEFVIWAAKSEKSRHTMNQKLMKIISGGHTMTDVWRIPAVASWEKKAGYHPTQKPLHLLYRIILASTNVGDKILDPFAGSFTTGVAACLLNRKCTGIEMDAKYVKLGKDRVDLLSNVETRTAMLNKMADNVEELTVLVNHARKELLDKMIETGICYLRAGDSKGSLLVASGFERMQYVLLHTAGKNPRLFRLNNKGRFTIWTAETLHQYGFAPEHAPYYVVLQFKPVEVPYSQVPDLVTGMGTYTPRLFPLSLFMKIK